MNGPTIVLTHPKTLSKQTIDQLARQMDAWTEGPRKALILEEGMQASIIGGLHFRLSLSDGPLDGVRFDINVARLGDLPAFFDYDGGRYEPWEAEDGRQMVTTDGDPVYLWEPAADTAVA